MVAHAVWASWPGPRLLRHTEGVRRIPVLFGMVFVACGGGQLSSRTSTSAQPTVVSPEPAKPAPNTLWREDVDPVLEAGPGSFLQKVQVQPVVDAGKFLGWEVMSLQPPHFWQDVDLAPGDVVLSINGMPVERPEHAMAVFQSLAKASELRVAYLRGAQERELAFKIVSRQQATAVEPPPQQTPTNPPQSQGTGGTTQRQAQ